VAKGEIRDLDILLNRVLGKPLQRSEVDMEADLSIHDETGIVKGISDKLEEIRGKHCGDG